MKVRVIVKQTIQDYTIENAQSRKPFSDWLTAIKFAEWTSPGDIQSTFGAADLLGQGSHRVVFDIGSNKYRMICKYHFGKKLVHLFICWIGTHAEYNELCSKSRQYTALQY
jgi:mRNA interferase HigB